MAAPPSPQGRFRVHDPRHPLADVGQLGEPGASPHGRRRHEHQGESEHRCGAAQYARSEEAPVRRIEVTPARRPRAEGEEAEPASEEDESLPGYVLALLLNMRRSRSRSAAGSVFRNRASAAGRSATPTSSSPILVAAYSSRLWSGR